MNIKAFYRRHKDWKDFSLVPNKRLWYFRVWKSINSYNDKTFGVGILGLNIYLTIQAKRNTLNQTKGDSNAHNS